MEVVVIIGVLLVPVFIGRVRMLTFWNPVTFFVIWWSLCLALGRWGALGLSTPSSYTYFLLSLSLVGFCFGFFLITTPVRGGVSKSGQTKDVLDRCITTPRFSVYVAVVLACVFGLLASSAMTVTNKLMQSGDATQVRGEFYVTSGESTLGSSHMMVLRDVVLKPVTWLVWGLCFIRVVRTNKWSDTLLLAASCLLFFLLDWTSFARTQGIQMGMLFLIGRLFGGPIVGGESLQLKRRIAPKLVLVFRCGLVASVLFLILVSALRTVSMRLDPKEVALRYISYYAMTPVLFEQRDTVISGDGFPYTIGGGVDILNLVARRFGVDHVIPQRTMSLQTPLDVGQGPLHEANALFTWCLPFYADLGAVGVLLVPMIFGVLLGWLYKRYLRSGSASHFLLFLVLYENALWGILEWKLSWPEGMATALVCALPCLAMWYGIVHPRQSSMPFMKRHRLQVPPRISPVVRCVATAILSHRRGQSKE